MSQSNLNICEVFPQFTPNSGWTSYEAFASLTIKSVNETIPLISLLGSKLGTAPIDITLINDFSKSILNTQYSNDLKNLFTSYGSDKSTYHDYHLLYGSIFEKKESIRNVLEFGLGTNNEKIMSHMGSGGRPGASLRSFRDFLPNSIIYGADIDREILFSEDRIQTFFVDQTDLSSFEELALNLPSELDIIIDDGLHSPISNLTTLNFSIGKIRKGGWIIIEDILPTQRAIWDVVSRLVNPQYKSYYISCLNGMVFAMQRTL